jgi:hypothetical protein
MSNGINKIIGASMDIIDYIAYVVSTVSLSLSSHGEISYFTILSNGP